MHVMYVNYVLEVIPIQLQVRVSEFFARKSDQITRKEDINRSENYKEMN